MSQSLVRFPNPLKPTQSPDPFYRLALIHEVSLLSEAEKKIQLFYALKYNKDDIACAILDQMEDFDVNSNFNCQCADAEESGSECPKNQRKFLCFSRFTFLSLAIHPGDASIQVSIDLVKKLLTFPEIDINAKDDETGSSVLMSAVGNGMLEMVKLLVSCNEIDLETTDNQGTILKEKAKEKCRGKKRTQILKCLRYAELERDKRQRTSESENREAMRKAKKRKVDEMDKSPGERERECEKARMELSLLEKEEEEVKEKINEVLKHETETVLTLEGIVKKTKLEDVPLEDESKEIESALDQRLTRKATEELLIKKASIAKEQESNKMIITAIEIQIPIFKRNMAAKVEDLEAKFAEIQGEINTAKVCLEYKRV